MNIAEKIKVFERRQIVVVIIALLAACGISIIFNNLHMTSMAEENTRFLTRFVVLGEGREVSLILNQAQVSNFNSIKYISINDSAKNFILPAKAAFETTPDLINSLVYDRATTNIKSEISSSNGDQIIYEFNRFKLVPYAIFAWLFFVVMLIPQAIISRRRLIEQINHEVIIEKKLSKAEIAREVRHNLRTPLAALMRIPQRLPSTLSNEKDLLDVTITQIKELVSKLDESKPTDLAKSQDTQIYDTLLSARQEIKEIIPSKIDFKFEIEDMISSDLVVHIPFELRALLSNMVLNSVEAIENHGSIVVRAIESTSHIVISISDTGIGIPSEIIPRLFEKDFSYRKAKGSGIGLYHAKTFISKWGGNIQVESIDGSGTILKISLPIKDKASWYLQNLKINVDTNIFILDDQQSALTLWQQKFSETSFLNQVSFYNHVSDFEKESSKWNAKSIFLIDYDMGSSSKNGIEVLKNVPKESLRCLVTGHFDDLEVRTQCEELGYYLIPKTSIESLRV